MQSDVARKILSLIDYTSLNESDTAEDISKLCEKAINPHGHVAAICVLPRFIPQIKRSLSATPIKIATVANFPSGNEALEDVILVIQKAIHDGAQEIDVVMPYNQYLAGKTEEAKNFIQKCKENCGNRVLLKVILESGAFKDEALLRAASHDMILAGADFLKTSTGKVEIGATPEAAKIILNVIQQANAANHRRVGFKVSGGVRTVEQAQHYITLVQEIMGPQWVSAETFRIGASQLVDAL